MTLLGSNTVRAEAKRHRKANRCYYDKDSRQGPYGKLIEGWRKSVRIEVEYKP